MWFTRLSATETKSAWKTKATRSSVLFQSLTLSADPRRAMQGPPRTQEAGPAEGAGGMDRWVGSLLPLDPGRKEPGPLPPGHFCPASWSEQPEVATSRPSCKDRDLTLPTSLPPPSPPEGASPASDAGSRVFFGPEGGCGSSDSSTADLWARTLQPHSRRQPLRIQRVICGGRHKGDDWGLLENLRENGPSDRSWTGTDVVLPGHSCAKPRGVRKEQT